MPSEQEDVVKSSFEAAFGDWTEQLLSNLFQEYFLEMCKKPPSPLHDGIDMGVCEQAADCVGWAGLQGGPWSVQWLGMQSEAVSAGLIQPSFGSLILRGSF